MSSRSQFIDYRITNDRETRAKEAITALQISQHDPYEGTLLDLGCGSGSTTKWFSKININSVGLELNKSFVGEARNKPLCLEYIQASGVSLPFQEKSFHTIILNDVLEHISYKNAIEAFKQIHKIMEDEGTLYVSVASKFEIIEPHSGVWFISWFPRWIYAPIVRKIFHDDVYPYTAKKFRKLMDQTNFVFENVTYLYVANKVKNLDYVGNTLLRPIIRALTKIGLTRNSGFLRFIEPFGVLVFICKKSQI